MKYKIGQELYYINPFVYTIEKVLISHFHDEYYCDETYAMFKEKELFMDLENAKDYATILLNTFHTKQLIEIATYKPKE